MRLVIARVMDDVSNESRYLFDELFGDDDYYDTLDDVVNAYRNQPGQG